MNQRIINQTVGVREDNRRGNLEYLLRGFFAYFGKRRSAFCFLRRFSLVIEANCSTSREAAACSSPVRRNGPPSLSATHAPQLQRTVPSFSIHHETWREEAGKGPRAKGKGLRKRAKGQEQRVDSSRLALSSLHLEAAARDEAVDVGMIEQLSGLGVEHADHPEAGADEARVLGRASWLKE
jgi:hypothetical protein